MVIFHGYVSLLSDALSHDFRVELKAWTLADPG